MAAPVRPPQWPTLPTTPKAGGLSPSARADARLTAQKAFFDAALAGKPKPSAPPVETPQHRAAPVQAVRSVAAAEARASDHVPPPGSIVNILV